MDLINIDMDKYGQPHSEDTFDPKVMRLYRSIYILPSIFVHDFGIRNKTQIKKLVHTYVQKRI